MSEGGIPLEAPPARPVMGVRERLARWTRETFTVKGRTERYERKYLAAYRTVLEQLSPQERAQAEKVIHEALARRAKNAVVRDAVITSLSAIGLGLGIWKREAIERFVGRVAPEPLKNAGSAIRDRARAFGEKIRAMPLSQRVSEWMRKIASLFRKEGPAIIDAKYTVSPPPAKS